MKSEKGILAHRQRRSTHLELQVHEHRRRNWQDVVRVRDREVGEERNAAPMELLKRKSAQTLDSKEHPERNWKLHERHQQHGQHAHARLRIHLALLKRNALHPELVPGLVRLFELLLELNQARLVRRERGSVAQLLDREREQNHAREKRARDDGVEPGQARRDVDELEHPRAQARGGPAGKT